MSDDVTNEKRVSGARGSSPASRDSAKNSASRRWLLAALVVLLVPVMVISVLQATRTTEAGRVAARPPANLFAKPLAGLVLPSAVGEHVLIRPEGGPILPHGQHDSVLYVTESGIDTLRTVVVEGQVASLADYEAVSGMRGIVRADRFSCGRMDQQAQCVGLLQGGFLVTIAVDPATEVATLAGFSNQLYADLQLA